jgi:type II secretory pathway predicted ATPase ExeA
MIRSHFGLTRTPFDIDRACLLPHQQQILDTLLVHAQQGGLCLVLGEPGTGKSAIKRALGAYDSKRMVAPVLNRTMHTYTNTVRILCQAFAIDYNGLDARCERELIQEAFRLHQKGRMVVPIIDDAHLIVTGRIVIVGLLGWRFYYGRRVWLRYGVYSVVRVPWGESAVRMLKTGPHG